MLGTAERTQPAAAEGRGRGLRLVLAQAFLWQVFMNE